MFNLDVSPPLKLSTSRKRKVLLAPCLPAPHPRASILKFWNLMDFRFFWLDNLEHNGHLYVIKAKFVERNYAFGGKEGKRDG